MVIEGNHEVESQINGESFVAYKARFAVPQSESKSGTNMYYSFNAGGIHFVMIGSYADYNKSSKFFSNSLNNQFISWGYKGYDFEVVIPLLRLSCLKTVMYFIDMFLLWVRCQLPYEL